MAQVVGYWTDNVTFTEGPFVVCALSFNNYRIEVQMDGAACPVLPDCSIYAVEQRLGWVGNSPDRERAEMVVNHLNLMVKQGKIVKSQGIWVHKEV